MALKVFLVEDNQTIRDNLIPTLADLAHAEVVGIAEGEHDATTWLSSHPDGWELAVVDLFLKEGSGLGVLRELQGRSPHQHAVVLTNYPTPSIRHRSLALGADAVFDKSTELDAFFAFCLQPQAHVTR
ncbi:response regulator [Variovorax boronicumulans]|uniref:response regulator n=1 Tax=Variovorax boronicumulans TaxID=436515 RepID=UPI001C59CC29